MAITLDTSKLADRLEYKVEAVIGSEMWAAHVEKMYKAQRAKAEKPCEMSTSVTLSAPQ